MNPLSLLSLLFTFFGPASASLRGHLNVAELVRVAVLAIVGGGGVLGVLTGIQADVGQIFPSPTDAAVAATVITAIADVVRRLGHGADPAQLPIPPAPGKSLPIRAA